MCEGPFIRFSSEESAAAAAAAAVAPTYSSLAATAAAATEAASWRVHAQVGQVGGRDPGAAQAHAHSRNKYSNRDTRTATALRSSSGFMISLFPSFFPPFRRSRLFDALQGVTDNPSILVANTSENEKKNKGIVGFVYAIADKMLPFHSALTFFGLASSHGPNPLLMISDGWIQVIAAGGVISTIGGILLPGAASYFKERELPDHPGFVLISTMLFFILQYSVLASCIILQGFERSSKWIIWATGALVELSIVAFWFAFQREPMIVGLKWTKDAFEWMLKWTKNAFERMLKWRKNAFECCLNVMHLNGCLTSKISEWRPRESILPVYNVLSN